LMAGWSLPEAPTSFPDRPEIIERTAIRITSEHKWPEKIVLDTSQPTFSPPIEVAPIQQPVESLPDEMAYQATVDAVTKPNPDPRPIDARRRSARSRRKRKDGSIDSCGWGPYSPRTSNISKRVMSVACLSGRTDQQCQMLGRASVSRAATVG
jgi:hypothetical protein